MIVVDSMDALQEYAAGWNEILDETGNRNPYLTREWMANWWRFFGEGRQPHILVMMDGAVLAGLCPLMVSRARWYKEVQFIGRPQVSRMGLIVRRGYEDAFARRVADHLVGLKGRYLINLQGFRQDDGNYQRLKHCLGAASGYTEQTLPLYRINLSRIPQQEFFRVRKRHSTIRQTLSRERSLSGMCRLTFERAKPDEVPLIFAIHDKRWQRKNDGNGFARGNSQRFFEFLAQNTDGAPWDCQVYLLKVEGKPIGFLYGILYRGGFIAYRIAHDNDYGLFKPGMLLVKRVIEACYEQECQMFDFSTGDEQYKTYWTDDHEQIATLCLGVGRPMGSLVALRHQVHLLRQTMKQVDFLVRFKRNTIGEIKYLLSGGPLLECLHNLRLAWRRKSLACLLGQESKLPPGDALRVFPKERIAAQSAVALQVQTIGDMEQIIALTGMDGKRICKRYMDGGRCLAILGEGAAAGYIWKTCEPIVQGGQTIWKPRKPGDTCYYDLCLYRGAPKELYRAVATGIGNEPPGAFAGMNYLLLQKRQRKYLQQTQPTQREFAGSAEAK